MFLGLLTAVVGHAAGAVRAVVGSRSRSGPDEGTLFPAAQHTTTTLVDDLDDTVTARETVSFGVDGTSYEIDLSTAHAAALREDLATWVKHARRTGGRVRPGARGPTAARRNGTGGRTTTTTTTTSSREHAAAVREWARGNGYEVSDRGRIPTAVQEAFDAAH
ncbi:Lsr2 family protein [Rhodococcus aerolatus]